MTSKNIGFLPAHPFTIPDSKVASKLAIICQRLVCQGSSAQVCDSLAGWPLLTQITSTTEQELNQPLCFFLPAFSKCLASSLENVQPQQQQCTFACFLSGSCCSEHIMYVNLLHLQGNSEPRYYLLKSPLWRHWSHEDRQHPESRSSGIVGAVSPASTSISLFAACMRGTFVCCLPSPCGS